MLEYDPKAFETLFFFYTVQDENKRNALTRSLLKLDDPTTMYYLTREAATVQLIIEGNEQDPRFVNAFERFAIRMADTNFPKQLNQEDSLKKYLCYLVQTANMEMESLRVATQNLRSNPNYTPGLGARRNI